uniref:Uncharacterized protein n=1 Tax=Anguilla anguilla TaxID=7936 RepID=A0A0E9SV48_ANGAN
MNIFGYIHIFCYTFFTWLYSRVLLYFVIVCCIHICVILSDKHGLVLYFTTLVLGTHCVCCFLFQPY